MLSIENITIQLNGQRKILNHLNLSVAAGEFVVIVGANGAGKSTLFNVISGTIKPTHGRVLIDGKSDNFAQVSRVFQDPRVGTIGNFTIFENMAFAFCRHRRRHMIPFYGPWRQKFFKERLATLHMHLEDRPDDLVSSLSGGQRQALSLLMSVIGNQRVLLLDEITAALDPKSSREIMALANEIVQREARTCLMITHNIDHAIGCGDRLIVLGNGEIAKEFRGREKKYFSQKDLIE
ncbi:MAG: ATP-binding cassette domain-containing protein [Puniceicoccales bacterium]|jgi:putative ABC transport system ATP-binding protein|nr:ATP-binding cassette domain-containing protein [Puniceicoccales bacterium]